MRDQLSSDAEHRHHASSIHSNSIGENGRKPATLESVATISYKNVRQDPSSKPLSVGPSDHNSNDDDRPALPASASWAKAGNSGPSTPTLKSTLPERSLTPDNFGPPLSVAVAAAAAQKQQQAAAASKRKMEKKKRKEQQLSQKAESSSGSRPATPSTIHDTELDPLGMSNEDLSYSATKGQERKYYDSLIQFVFGDALNDWKATQLNSSEDTDDDAPVGVSALHDDTENEKTPAVSAASEDEATENPVTPLEFLMKSGPTTPVYNGSFNPFAHQILRSTGSLFESPMRKCSRFGFAQI